MKSGMLFACWIYFQETQVLFGCSTFMLSIFYIMAAWVSFCLAYICLFVSLLSHFWLIHLFYLHLLYQPYVGLCQATCVQSHHRQPTLAVAIATGEVQVSAADSHTVPTVATGVSKPLCCRLTLTFTLTSENLSLYITLLLLLVVIQLCSPRCWHLDSNYCRTRCRQSQLRFVLSPLLLHLRLLIVPVGYSTFHIDLAS